MAARAVKHAFVLAGRQGRLAGGDPAESVSLFDQLVLTAVYLLRGAGYSVSITDKVSEMSGSQVVLGSTFGSLGRLERGGLVTARLADPQTEPEHKGRRYFTVTLAGERVLAEARATSRIVADFLGDFA
jgi:DNA-binding PadR family transcriptional regulator